LKELEHQELTAVMQEAIVVTQRLGYRYLWIDALCIVQYSEEDWLREAGCMSQVFSSAIVTLAVGDASDHLEGIFRPRRGRCVRPFWIPFCKDIPYRERIAWRGEGEVYVFPKTDFVSAGPRPKGILDTRGWILQEQLLSPCLLYFGDGEIFWDCTAVSASESSPILTSLLNDPNPDETWALKLIRKTFAASADTETLRLRFADVWKQVIKNYSARQLSKPTYSLIALEGVIRPLVVLLADEPVAGMWMTQLWQQLIWWVNPSLSTATPSGLPADQSFMAPTWSWLSAHEPVHY
ncbi:hypothetical protein EK21DRAFT_41759, partial [Setomelanomma holmii]